MTRCDCQTCICRRWAMRLFVGFIVLLFVAAIVARTAHAADVETSVCSKLELPGPAFTLNPHDPPDKQRQQVVTVCETIKLPDPRHVQHRFEPVTDYGKDTRAFT